jgi:hypothetical protein
MDRSTRRAARLATNCRKKKATLRLSRPVWLCWPVSSEPSGISTALRAVYGEEARAHSRSAIGAANLPLDSPVIIEAEIEID